MITKTITVRQGEDMGPIDWAHDVAKDRPQHWRDAEQHPESFTYGEFCKPIIRLRMYDGWPYWKPRPGIFYEGPLGPEWAFFDSYGSSVNPVRRAAGSAA